MKVAIFSTKPFDRRFLEEANSDHQHELVYFEPHLTFATAPLAAGYDAVCVFVNDQLDGETLALLHQGGTRTIALRCAGFNNVDLVMAEQLDMQVVRVPAYSPYAVAEHAVALILALNRKIHRAHNRIHDGNFSLDGLLGFDLHGRTVGVIGTGKIGRVFAKIMAGFGCEIIAYDPYPNQEVEKIGGRYVTLNELYKKADIVSLHCPLTPETYHLINATSIQQMRPGTMVINSSRGALIDTPALIHGLKSGRIGYVGLDVYEEEGDLFFEDFSGQIIQDDVFARLMTFPNVIITGHQAFFTEEALSNIAGTTLANLSQIEAGEPCPNRVTAEMLIK